MPRISVVYYRDAGGITPFLAWFDILPEKVQDKCRIKIERLRALGFELRRPESDYLRDGIHELRLRQQRINYRILYFFHGRSAAVVSHGIIKEQKVPETEINRALERKRMFEKAPERHTHQESL